MDLRGRVRREGKEEQIKKFLSLPCNGDKKEGWLLKNEFIEIFQSLIRLVAKAKDHQKFDPLQCIGYSPLLAPKMLPRFIFFRHVNTSF